MEPRLATSVWVAALLRRAAADGVYGAVLSRGDPVAGAVVLLGRARSGALQAWRREGGGVSGTAWAKAIESTPEDAAKLDSWLSRQRNYDPDLWIVELVTDEMTPFIVDER